MSRRGLARHAARRDENEPEIRKRFAAHGWHTEQVSGKGMPDLVCMKSVRHFGQTRPTPVLFLCDVKMPKGRLKPAQEKKWTELAEKGIPVYVVRTEADVDALVRGELDPWRPDAVKRAEARKVAAAIENYTPPRAKPVNASREAEETFALSPHPATCRCVTCGPARICE